MEAIVAGLGPVGWQLLRRPSMGRDYTEHVVLGPFISLAECERNIRDHERTQNLKH